MGRSFLIIFMTMVLCMYCFAGESLESIIDGMVLEQISIDGPGGVVAVLSGDEVILKRFYGMENLDGEIPISQGTVFDLASAAKQFTAFGILNLEKEGKLSFDDDIRNYLSELPCYGHKVTIHNLLQHTSGIPSSDVLRLFSGLYLDEKWTQEDEIGIISRYPYLNFKPNARHLYSNSGYAILASIIEKVSEKTFADFMRSQVFKPLGMKSGFVLNESSDIDKIAIGYGKENDSFVKISSFDDMSLGSGNIFASIDDMILWSKNILSPKIGRKDYLNIISEPFNTLENGYPVNYTYGFYAHKYKGIRIVEHSGGVPGFRSHFAVFPDEKLIIILMFNNENISLRRLLNGIADTVLKEKLKEDIPVSREEIEIERNAIKAFEGRYHLSDGNEMVFYLDEEGFWLKLPSEHKFQLYAESENKFFLRAFDAQCTFLASEEGNVNDMIWHQRGQDYHGERIPDAVIAGVEDFPSFAGIYYQPHLRSKYSIIVEEDQLILYTPENFQRYLGSNRYELSPMNKDKFNAGMLGLLEFMRNEQGEINGFILLNVGRIQNIRFLMKALQNE